MKETNPFFLFPVCLICLENLEEEDFKVRFYFIAT